MTRLFLTAAACAALAACGNPAEEADEPVVAETPMAAPTTANNEMAGTYEVTMADGTVVTQTIRSDGTYSDVADGEVTEAGTWRAEGQQLCYDPEGTEPEECYTGSQPGADGSFTFNDADGNQMGTVRRIGDENMAAQPTA